MNNKRQNNSYIVNIVLIIIITLNVVLNVKNLPYAMKQNVGLPKTISMSTCFIKIHIGFGHTMPSESACDK